MLGPSDLRMRVATRATRAASAGPPRALTVTARKPGVTQPVAFEPQLSGTVQTVARAAVAFTAV